MIELIDDPAQFARRAGPLLDSRIENTVLATVLCSILAGGYADPPPRFAVVVDGAGQVVGAALRTPPYPLVCTDLGSDDADGLIARWLEVDPELPAVNARTETVRALADAVVRRTGARDELDIRQALHAVDRDGLRAPARPAKGRLRAPIGPEVERCAEWEVAFAREAEVVVSDADVVRGRARRRIAEGRAYVWDGGEDAGAVCLVGHTPVIAGVPRIGPVYTPPEHRSRGYASGAVAALTDRLLVSGADRVILFTDLANPTSNRIYAAVGYRRVGDWEIHRLAR